MTQELFHYYGFSAPPFTKELPIAELQQLPSVEQALSSLQMLVSTKGIGVVTGKSGTGKSSLLRLLNEQLHPGLYKGFYICHTSVGVLEFYTHLCTAFGLEPSGKRAIMFRRLKDRIMHLSSNAKRHPVLMIDEASLLNNDILREIRLLTNFEMDSYNAMTIILCGQESLLQKFGLSILEPLANSITVSVSLSGLKKEETFAYVDQRLKATGVHTELFTKNALSLIHDASAGIIRTINTIANGALLNAWFSKSLQVEAEHVQSVIKR